MNTEVLENLSQAIMCFDNELAAKSARRVIEEKVDIFKALDVMTKAIRQIGDGYRRGELFLPELVGAGAAMSSAMPILETELKKAGKERETLGVVVSGTVYGDIHSIGMILVGTLLVAGGFSVHNLGTSIKPEEFVEAVKEHKADILAMSALMTTTAPEQKRTIDALKAAGIRDKVKIMVGGAAISQEFADSIGADGYAAIAPGAVPLAEKLVANRGGR